MVMVSRSPTSCGIAPAVLLLVVTLFALPSCFAGS